MNENSDIEDWLEEQIQDRFPDNLNIEPGRLRVRISILCSQYKDKLLSESSVPLPEDKEEETRREFWSDPCWSQPTKGA